MGKNSLTQHKLKTLLSYDKDTGQFTNLKTGNVVGWHHSGYLRTYVLGKKYYLHRLVWLYVFGRFPDHEIDHINNDRSDNRFTNLREATREQNLRNKPVRCDNQTGLKGVEFIKKLNKYRAVISFRGVRRRLGTFATAEQASEAYKQEALKLHKEFYYEWTHVRLQ